MFSWVAWLIAIVCAAAFVVLWFREVRHVLRSRKSTVDSAARQLVVCREKADSGLLDPDTTAILERSENIYWQAVTLYNDAVGKPWNRLPL